MHFAMKCICYKKIKVCMVYIIYILYICIEILKYLDMEAIMTPKKRKVIDIPEDVFKYLSIKAATRGTNLKKYIESLLAKDVEDIDDSETYRQLLKSDPDGLLPASKEEQKEFRQWLNISKGGSIQ